MLTGRQVAALAAVGLAAAGIGFAGAAALGGGEPPPSPTPLPAVAAVTASGSPPEEALLSPQPPEVAVPVADPAPVPEPVPEPELEPEPEPAPTRREPVPAPQPEPDPSSSTTPEPAPETTPQATPTPVRPPLASLAEPVAPPQGIRIPAGAEPSGYEPARRALAEALSRASAGSVEGADIRRQLDLWRAYLGPDAAGAPEARRATIARALRANAWWFATRGSPRSRVLLRDEDGIILTYRAGQGFVVNPVATTGRWRDLNADVPRAGARRGAARRWACPGGRASAPSWPGSTTTSPTTPSAIRPGSLAWRRHAWR